MKYKKWIPAIGCLAAAASMAQDRERDHGGWLFDGRRGERALAAGGKRFDPAACTAIWDAAWRAGPRVGRGLVGDIEHLPASGAARLTVLLAMGLSGGRTVRDHLVDRGLQRRFPPEVVAACIASARPLAGVAPEALQKVASNRQRREVERLAAGVALLASGAAIDERLLADLGDRSLQRLITALTGCVRPELPLRQPIEPPSSTLPESGSLAELAERAALLCQAARPGQWPRETVLLALQRSRTNRRAVAAASLALGRLRRVGRATDLADPSALDQPMFLCGLETAEGGLQDLLLQGPGASRDASWHALWWAAAARLLDASRLDPLLDALLAIDAEETARAGLVSLCHRLLSEPGVRLQPGEAARASLLAPARGEEERYRIAIAYLVIGDEALSEERTRRLDPRTRYALDLFRGDRLEPPGAGGMTLWRHLRHGVFAGASDVPGTFAGALLAEVNALVRDVFVGGRRGGTREGGWLPDGIHRETNDYFEVLDLHLADWPLFRGLR